MYMKSCILIKLGVRMVNKSFTLQNSSWGSGVFGRTRNTYGLGMPSECDLDLRDIYGRKLDALAIVIYL